VGHLIKKKTLELTPNLIHFFKWFPVLAAARSADRRHDHSVDDGSWPGNLQWHRPETEPCDLSMRYVEQTVARCFVVLRQMRSIRPSVSTSIFRLKSSALCFQSWTGQCYIGCPSCLLNKSPQTVLNAIDRSIAGLSRSLGSHHKHPWQFPPVARSRANSSNRRSLSTELFTGPRLDKLLVWSVEPRCWHMSSRSRLRSSTSNQLIVRPSRLVTAGQRSFCFLLARSYGTVFRMTLHLLRHSDSVSTKTENTLYFDSHIWTFLCKT